MRKVELPMKKRILVEFDYTDSYYHFSEVVLVTDKQKDLIDELLCKAEGNGEIANSYCGEQGSPSEFEEFLERLKGAINICEEES